MKKDWKRLVTNIGQVLALLWTMAVLFFYMAISGTANGSGIMGSAPSNSEKIGTNVGVLILIILFIATILSWKQKFIFRFGVSITGLILFHAIVFGIYG